MAEPSPDLRAFFSPASRKDVRKVTDQILEIWEHPRTEYGLELTGTSQTIPIARQTVESADVWLKFKTPSRYYPQVDVMVEETLFPVSETASMVSVTEYRFSPAHRFFGTPRYVAAGIFRRLSIEDIAVEDGTPESEVVIPDISEYAGLSFEQRRAVIKGRADNIALFTPWHAQRLLSLFAHFDTDKILVLEPDEEEAEGES